MGTIAYDSRLVLHPLLADKSFDNPHNHKTGVDEMTEDVDGEKWYSFEEFPPEPGQLCHVKLVTTMQAYYTPDCKQAKWITPDYDQLVKQLATSWSPVKNARKMKGYNLPNQENPYEDLD